MKLTSYIHCLLIAALCATPLTFTSCGSDSDSSSSDASVTLTTLPYTMTATYPGDNPEIFKMTPINKTEGTVEYEFEGADGILYPATGTYRWVVAPSEESPDGEVHFFLEEIVNSTTSEFEFYFTISFSSDTEATAMGKARDEYTDDSGDGWEQEEFYNVSFSQKIF